MGALGLGECALPNPAGYLFGVGRIRQDDTKRRVECSRLLRLRQRRLTVGLSLEEAHPIASTGDPRALTFDASGTLYVGTDAGTVWSVDSAGEPTMVATGFDSIGGMAFDASGALYLAGEKEVLKILTR